MPDGDKFYRSLIGTGRGWGTVYRLACNNDDAAFVKDSVLKAIADNLRRIPPDSLEKAIGILNRAFEDERCQKLGLPSSDEDNFLKLQRALNLSKFQGSFYLVMALNKSVEKVFLAYRNSCLSLSEEQIVEKFSQTLANEILKSPLSKVKDGIMEKQNRNALEHFRWLKALEKEIEEPAKKFLKGFVKGKHIRKPITRKIDKDATSNILNRSLKIL